MIESEVRWVVGHGNYIRIREDVWLPSSRIGGPVNQHDPKYVEELIEPSNQEWEQGKLTELFDEKVVQEILSIPLSSNSQMDKLVWKGNRTDLYSFKSGYNRLCSQAKKPNANIASTSYQPPRNL